MNLSEEWFNEWSNASDEDKHKFEVTYKEAILKSQNRLAKALENIASVIECK